VEVFFNLVWVAVSVALFAVWLTALRQERKQSRLPAVGTQIVALAILVVILLPVISLTDDLQAVNTPAEAEHLFRRGDLEHAVDQSLHSLPVALGQLVSGLVLPPTQQIAFTVTADPPVWPMRGYSRAATTRPPPAV
jgi:hypothetical protein